MNFPNNATPHFYLGGRHARMPGTAQLGMGEQNLVLLKDTSNSDEKKGEIWTLN